MIKTEWKNSLKWKEQLRNISFFGIEVAIPIMFIQAINKACGRGRFEVM